MLKYFLIITLTLGCHAGCQEKTDTKPSSESAVSESPGLKPHQPADPELREQRKALLRELKSEPYAIESEKALQAIAATPREEFVLESTRHLAYKNRPLPITDGQTISQPYIVAFMTETLKPKPGDKVLEIGTGSGYQAAVLSPLVDHVYSIEIVENLATTARKRLDRLGYDNVTVKHGDGYRGWPEHAPFDSIIVTAAPDDVPQPLVDQLKEGGRMVIPVGSGFSQELYVLEKEGGEVKQKSILPVRFVPMTGEAQEN